jgi:subtilisin-like proprotein convertase family protein
VYQNSWGSPDTGTVSDSGSLFAQAIETGITQGRGGLGSIFVFSGGNGGEADNANLDGFVNRRGVITVCGVNQQGERMRFSGGAGTEPGANVLVCAPAINITTTAINGGMRSDFSGTSAATPMVSGVAALMLSVNPALSWRDVPYLLAITARKNHASDPEWSLSPAGRWIHPFYGFGVIDAGAAVAAARTWSSMGGAAQQRQCDSGEKQVDRPIPDNDATGVQVQIALNCPQITRIEFVEIELTTTHTYHGDLRIDLVSPQGGNSRLVSERQCYTSGSDACGAYTAWRFGSVRHLDETASGVWTLRVSDRVNLDTGRILKWRVIVHGR